MFKRATIVLMAVLTAFVLLTGTASAEECVQLLQYKYCL